MTNGEQPMVSQEMGEAAIVARREAARSALQRLGEEAAGEIEEDRRSSWFQEVIEQCNRLAEVTDDPNLKVELQRGAADILVQQATLEKLYGPDQLAWRDLISNATDVIKVALTGPGDDQPEDSPKAAA